ncbi:MAG: hypothetical protein JWO38_7686 [Gemmataceae bacterium]|nr:hypothetical protein [Gemmataceae bacterium]
MRAPHHDEPTSPDPKIVAVSGGMMTIKEGTEFSTLSKHELYARMKDGSLQYVQWGKRRMIVRSSLLALLAARMANA